MKVKDIIKKLKKYDQEKEVFVIESGSEKEGYYSSVVNVRKVQQKRNLIMIIHE